ncbi:MAG: hypothetical protein A4E32_01495 [Methanomassiliicoccales archaeon PtaU1.Bin124]|nr:MAG: hypothetical protein A4E32_01495 [Methanomassiliicoccales archaeon PtaU1.Bin124]
MEIVLTVQPNGNGEGGNILVQRKESGTMKDMGTVKFDDHGQKKWLLMVLMEMHPYVSLVEN